MLPPGSQIATNSGEAKPENATDAVRRLGHGYDHAATQPIQMSSIRAVHRILSVLAHSSLVGAALLSEGKGRELPDRLAAIVIHVAATSASAIVAATSTTRQAETLHKQSRMLADAAAALHGLPLDLDLKTQRPARGSEIRATAASSSIDRMPAAPEDVTAAGIALPDRFRSQRFAARH